MPAARLNYIAIFKGESQVFGSASKQIVLESPPPPGVSLEDKRVFFITYQPDGEKISVHQIPQEEVLNAQIKQAKKKESNE